MNPFHRCCHRCHRHPLLLPLSKPSTHSTPQCNQSPQSGSGMGLQRIAAIPAIPASSGSLLRSKSTAFVRNPSSRLDPRHHHHRQHHQHHQHCYRQPGSFSTCLERLNISDPPGLQCYNNRRRFGTAADKNSFQSQTSPNETFNTNEDTNTASPQLSQPPRLPRQFLQAYDTQNFDPATHQRNDVPFDPVDGKPPRQQQQQRPSLSPLTQNANEPSAPTSEFSKEWMNSQVERWRADPADFDCSWASASMNMNDHKENEGDGTSERIDQIKRVLWSNWTESMIRDADTSPILFDYNELIHGNAGSTGSSEERQQRQKSQQRQQRLLTALYQYGIVLITGTPSCTDSLPAEVRNPAFAQSTQSTQTTQSAPSTESTESAESAILNLASIIGYYPMQTLYGSGVWSTSSYSSFYNTSTGAEDSDRNSSNANSANSANNASNASTADSAYGSTSLPLHTDMTYLTNPPGVQIFLMVQPATATDSSNSTSNITSHGTSTSTSNSISNTSTKLNEQTPFQPKGQSVYLDGFAAANQLLRENPEAFHLLATTPRRYRCVDDQEGWHLEARGRVIEAVPRWRKNVRGVRGANDATNARNATISRDDEHVGNLALSLEGGFGEYEWGPVSSIRHNDLDRLPDLPPYPSPHSHHSRHSSDDNSQNEEFYTKLQDAHAAWDDILSRDSMRFVIDLQPGDCVLVANQRCMHGRYAFETSVYPRVVMGCYVGMDELSSKWRRSGLRVL